MSTWYIDEGLQRFKQEWVAAHPGAVVYSIGDANHDTDPNVTQHAPDRGGSLPGDDKGEVDALDVMPGKTVSAKDLDDLFEELHDNEDPRIFYVIHRNRIFSSVTQPWVIRPYSGAYHDHVHISVNDKFDDNESDWKWEKAVARTVKQTSITGTLPELQYGDEDANYAGSNQIVRVQVLLNNFERSLPSLDEDGVYGANTKRKLAKFHDDSGDKISIPQLKNLLGIN